MSTYGDQTDGIMTNIYAGKCGPGTNSTGLLGVL